MKQWYEELFVNSAESYDREPFTQGTIGECDFIEKELNFDKSKRIVDIGCGTGRHTIELTKRGYNVTGIDLSESQLERARAKAKEAGLDIKFLRMDARDITLNEQFDLATIICEGAFPLMETDEMNYMILKNVANTVKAGGKLIMTTLNVLFPLFHSVKDFINSKNEQTNYEILSFDLMTFRESNTITMKDDYGNEKTLACQERYYAPSEITWLLNSVGFTKVEIFGCKLGAYSREDRLTTEDFEMLIIAEKAI